MEYLTDEDLARLNDDGESDRVERKRNASDSGSICEAICAFANDLSNRGKPGVVFVGVEDDGSSARIDITDRLLQTLAHMRDDGNITPFPQMEVRKITLAGGPAAAIVVQPSYNPPVRYKGRTLIRVGPRRAIATPEEEQRLVERRRSSNLPFDAQAVQGASQEDLDLVRFTLEYLPALVSHDTIEQNERSVMQQLRALRLVDRLGTPTTTALLMIGISPQDWFPGAAIAWRRVDGTDLTDDTIDDRLLTGTLPDQLRLCDELADASISLGLRLTDHVHTREAQYPLAALQQVVRNALIHRAYDGTRSPVRITWFSDRIEILSPGGPFGLVTPLNLGQPGITDYRNPTIAESLKGYGYVEKFGQGIAIAQRALARNGNPPLELTAHPPDDANWVVAIIRAKS